MQHKSNLFLLFSIGILLSIISSCKHENASPNVRINSILINNEGEFDLENGLTYAVIDSETYELDVKTEPLDATVFYSFNGGDIQQKSNQFIVIDSNDKYISFFSNSNGDCMIGTNRLDFGYGNDSLNSEITTFPNPSDSLVTFNFQGHFRGQLTYNISNIIGVELISDSIFVPVNSISYTLDLSFLPTGVYISTFQFGNTITSRKIVIK
jgi:hypothetical protein